jgi:Glycosyltransferase family 87
MIPMDSPDAGTDHDRPNRLRRDPADGPDQAAENADEASSKRLQRWLLGLLGVLMVVFSAPPLYNVALGKPNKDYGLWYQVGAALRKGYDIYPDPSSGRLFPFMYPPSAAALLGYVSYVGEYGTIFLLTLVHSIAWLGAIVLSVKLATGGKASGRNPLLYVVPSLCIVALIHNSYMLGQPNLTLLTLLLAAFYCLQKGRDGWAGALVATGAAIKAFPILALGYLVYRRKWRASAAAVAALAAWLLVVPLPFRTPAQAVRDVKVWAGGMLFTYNSKGIAQRPFRSFSYKNQSIMALAHRFLRDVPADGEAVLSRLTSNFRKERAQMGLHADGSIDLPTILTAPDRPTELDKVFESATADLQKAWRVNVASLDFRTVTLITVSAMLGLSLFVALAMPPARRRTARTDALEFALITLLIVMFSPLSFNYAFVWLIYPITVALNEILEHPAPAGRRRILQRAGLGAILLIPALAVPMPLYAQAWGNLFVPALLLVFTLGWTLHRVGRLEIPPPSETAPLRGVRPHAASAGASALSS